MTNYWLMKSEPHVYSFDELIKDGSTHWDGVRNYQARNFMRDKMRIGDMVLYYHSNTKPPHIAGISKISPAQRLSPRLSRPANRPRLSNPGAR